MSNILKNLSVKEKLVHIQLRCLYRTVTTRVYFCKLLYHFLLMLELLPTKMAQNVYKF
jgi:hypothetical protein